MAKTKEQKEAEDKAQAAADKAAEEEAQAKAAQEQADKEAAEAAAAKTAAEEAEAEAKAEAKAAREEAETVPQFVIMIKPDIRGTPHRKGHPGALICKGGECKVPVAQVSAKLNEGYTLKQ